MSQPIRVLQVFAALNAGGVENFVMNAYRRIDTSKIQFDFAMTSGKKGYYDEEVLSMGGRIFYFDSEKSLTDNLENVLRNEGSFAAVHSHIFFYSGLVVRTAKKCGVPVRIAHAHNAHTGESRSIARIVYELTMRHLINANSTVMLGCSEKACRYVFGDNCMTDRRVSVLPDGIDCGRFAFNSTLRENVRREYGLEGKFVIGHVGHFNPAKNHDKVLSVFAEAAAKRDDAMLLLVGDGNLENAVREKAYALGISEKTVFAGAHKDVEKMYHAMDVFLFPSRYEGFGMAMIEAQLSGLACVASDVVPEDTNADGRCVYISLEDPDCKWADTVLSAPERTTAFFDVIKSRFDVISTTDTLNRIYTECE